jgi:hypothetical protein
MYVRTIEHPSCTWTIYSMYVLFPRVQINPFWRDFQHSIEQSFNFTQHVVVTGDLNVDLLHEQNHVLNDIIQ